MHPDNELLSEVAWSCQVIEGKHGEDHGTVICKLCQRHDKTNNFAGDGYRYVSSKTQSQSLRSCAARGSLERMPQFIARFLGLVICTGALLAAVDNPLLGIMQALKLVWL